MMMAVSNLVRILGLGLALAALATVSWKAAGVFNELGRDFLTASFLLATGLASCAYAGMAALIGLAWHSLLAGTGLVHLSLSASLAIFGRSQLLKYLPTNVLHYVGRHVAAYRQGAPHAALVWSTIAETLIMVTASGLIGSLFAYSLIASSLERFHLPLRLSLMSLALVAIGFVGATVYLLKRGAVAEVSSRSFLTKDCAIAFGLYLLFFFANGLLLAGLVGALPGAVSPSPLLLIGLVSLAWIAGFVTPGAPAGIGVRDLILTIGLEKAGLGSIAVSVALAYRVTTVVGDVLFALAASSIVKVK